MAKKRQDTSDKSAPSFEESLAELESVVHDLEHGDLGLAEALERYELGVKRLRECQLLLEKAEQRIEVLTRVDAEGRAVTRPLAGNEQGEEDPDDEMQSRPTGKSKGRTTSSRRVTAEDLEDQRRADGGLF